MIVNKNIMISNIYDLKNEIVIYLF